MAETYYIRLPLYIKDGTTPRNIDITFDGSVISTAEITATDTSAVNYVNFSVSKDPGIYVLKITPKPGEDPNEAFTTVCLEDVWVSNDNNKFYSVILNYYPGKNPLNTNPSNDVVGFNPAKGASLYENIEFSVDINLRNAEDWSKLYNIESVEAIKDNYNEVLVNGDAEQKANAPKIMEAYDLLKARGYI